MFVPFRKVGVVRYLPEGKSGQYLMMRVAFVLYTIGGRIGGVKSSASLGFSPRR